MRPQHIQLERILRVWSRRLVSVAILQTLIFLISLNAQAPEATIDVEQPQQVIRGYGAANILPWRADMTPSEIQAAFGTGPGQAGFSILRLRVPPDAGEFAQNVPTALAAHNMGVTIIASPWSPPAAMKTNSNTVGGRLDTASYAAYAAHLKSFVDYMASNGVPIYAISVQNEPDIQVGYESCDWNATEMVNFIGQYGDSVGTKLIAPESFQFIPTISNAILGDSAATKHVDIIGGHIYGGGRNPYPLAAEKGKELWMTEYLINSGGPPTNLQIDTGWAGGIQAALAIHDIMNAGMNAYIWWYIVRYYGPIADGEQGTVKGDVTKKGYVTSQYSRFIRPGYQRVYSTIPTNSVRVTAYKGDDKVIVVAVNTSTSSLERKFNFQNLGGLTATVTPYVTTATKNCEQGSAFTLSDGNFTFTVEDSSVTTFVISDIVSSTDIKTIPQTFMLSQNYPNPFNPATVISYQMPVAGRARITIYNVLGEKLTTLVNREHQPGEYKVQWDAVNYPSGVYFYRLESGAFTQTRKMLLLK